MITYMLNSVWHAILDNFRPITVWGLDLFIFYFITVKLGEPWTIYSYVQLLGMFILLYGTAVYNAPNPGSIKLTGGFSSFFMDFSDEYIELEEELEEIRLEEEAEISAGTSLLTPGGTAYKPYRVGIPTSPFQMTPGGSRRRSLSSARSPHGHSHHDTHIENAYTNAYNTAYTAYTHKYAEVSMTDQSKRNYGSVNQA